MASENETVEAAIDAVRKMIHDCPAIKGGLGEFGYQLKANGAIDRIEAAHRREVAELRECLNRRSKHINTILQKALELGKSVPLELREVMDDCIVAEDKAIGFGVFSKKVRR